MKKQWMVGAAALVVLAGAGCEAGPHHRVVVQAPRPVARPARPEKPAPRQASAPASPGFTIRHAPAAPPSPAPAQDPAAALVAQVEQSYQHGLDLYHAGRLDEARATFNHALTLLLTSPLNVRATPVLQAELERVMDQTHALEVNALEAGDGFTAQKPEPAPIDAVAEMTFPVDAATRAQVEQQIRDTSGDLPLVLNDQVIQYIHYFTTSGKGFLEDTFKRAGRYRPMIERIFKQEGVPQDLIYLAQAESGFEPKALSVAGARGMWQFMAEEANDYHLQRNWWVDERQDPEKSTLAAAEALKDLYHQFGDWYLAMAAYNSGVGTVERAVARTGYADFWELYRRDALPRQTRNYVPIILAMALIAKNPQQYGLNRIVEDKPLTWDTVSLKAPIDLRLAAELDGTTVNTLRRLNPSLLRLTTPNETRFDLHLPRGTADRFEQALALIPPDKRVVWRYHRVQRGESISEIAHRYHSTIEQIVEVNNLSPHQGVKMGQQLVIPIHREARRSGGPGRYRVRRGDTLGGISHRFGVSVAELRRWNGMHGSLLRIGQELAVQSPERLARSRTEEHRSGRTRGRGRYRIHRGDTLGGIAHRFGVSVAELRRWNHLHGSLLQPGHILYVHPR